MGSFYLMWFSRNGSIASSRNKTIPTRMLVQRGRDDHIWRLPTKNAVTRMVIYAKLHGNYMFIFHMNNHEWPTNFH